MSAPLKPKVLISGLPGSGKTTLIWEVVKNLSKPVHGFFTREIRDGGNRIGFEIETFSKPIRKGILAHIDNPSKYRVGKYGIAVDDFEDIALPEIDLGIRQKSLIVIDEIGKMELYSQRFRQTVARLFNYDLSILASIMLKPHPFCDKIKAINGLHLKIISTSNRESLIDEISGLLTNRAAK